MANLTTSADSVIVFDFETTGLSPAQGCRVIEIGAVKIDNGTVTQSFQELMNPGCRINSFIESYTGISNRMLEFAPSCEEVMVRFVDFIGNSNLVAHNASFDRKFLNAEFRRINIDYRARIACSMLIARRVYPDAPNHKLGTLVSYKNLPNDGTYHRALADSQMTAHLWLTMLEDVKIFHELKDVSFELMHKLSKVSKSNVYSYLSQQAKRHIRIKSSDHKLPDTSANVFTKDKANQKIQNENFKNDVDKKSQYLGCILGGAIGDALGAPIEFSTLHEIRNKFGTDGLRDFQKGLWPAGSITDDTQMTLFTAEGLIRAEHRWLDRGLCDWKAAMHRAYIRWLNTQGLHSALREGEEVNAMHPGWLMQEPGLKQRRAPGNTCLKALTNDEMGKINRPFNNSKGCGGVMRVAPIGLVATSPDEAFEYSCDVAAITHGHPSGYLAAGTLSSLIKLIIDGCTLDDAINQSLELLAKYENCDEVMTAVKKAQEMADQRPIAPETIELLGSGWVAEEALAIAIYSALVSKTYEQCVILAVNHSGDSDSTGSIAGNIYGALVGVSGIAESLLGQLEMREVIEAITLDLYDCFNNPEYKPSIDDYERYPPN